MFAASLEGTEGKILWTHLDLRQVGFDCRIARSFESYFSHYPDDLVFGSFAHKFVNWLFGSIVLLTHPASVNKCSTLESVLFFPICSYLIK
jgi:hypothetical protein